MSIPSRFVRSTSHNLVDDCCLPTKDCFNHDESMNFLKCFCLIISLIVMTVNALSTPEANTNKSMSAITNILPGKLHTNSYSAVYVHTIFAPPRGCPGQQKVDAQGNCRDIV